VLRDKNGAIMLIDKSVLKISKYLCTRTKYRLNKKYLIYVDIEAYFC
jgi:hypothetical protein